MMCAIWNSHANNLAQFMVENNAEKAHLYLEQLMLFPLDVQDEIIDEISHLPHCSKEAIAAIIHRYSMQALS